MLSTDSIFTAEYAFPICFTVSSADNFIPCETESRAKTVSVLKRCDSCVDLITFFFQSSIRLEEINRERRKLLRAKFVASIEISDMEN